MQDVARRSFKPFHIATGAKARDDPEAGRHVAVELQAVLAFLQTLWVEEHRQVVDHAVMLAHAQVVRPGGVRQLDRLVVHQRIVGVDHAIVEVGRLLTEVEEHHLLAVLIHLEVRADAPVTQAAGPVGVGAQCF